MIVELSELDRLDLVLRPVAIIGQGAGPVVVDDVVVLVVGTLAELKELALEVSLRLQLLEDGVVEEDAERREYRRLVL